MQLTPSPVTVRSLHIHPVKSARAIEVEEARLGDRGFEHDRRFMIVDARGEFLTQREHHRMALLHTRIDGDRLHLSAPDLGGIVVPLRPDRGDGRKVRVWGDECDALSLGDEARAFCERFFGFASELVYMPDESIRLVDEDYASEKERVGFADAFPVLLISQASLDDLNARLSSPVPMDRFRPNIVVEGCAPFAEDDWGEFSLSGVVFQGVKPCSRCVMTTVDQRTGEAGKEPLATLSEYRKQGGKVMFGQNLLHRGEGVVRRGDRLELRGS